MEYKGWEIEPIPYKLRDGRWKVKAQITLNIEVLYQENQEFYDSEEKAMEASIRFGKWMVDQKED